MESVRVTIHLIQSCLMIRNRVMRHVKGIQKPRSGMVRVMLNKFVGNVPTIASFPIMHAMI